MANPFGLTDAQVERQLDKIQELLFETVQDIPDSEDEYKGVVKQEVLNIFIKEFPIENQKEPLTEKLFEEKIRNIGVNLVNHINDATDNSINEKLLLFFLSDFISQIMATIFSVHSEEEFDPMFG
jgi:hypothetical protein